MVVEEGVFPDFLQGRGEGKSVKITDLAHRVGADFLDPFLDGDRALVVAWDVDDFLAVFRVKDVIDDLIEGAFPIDAD